MTSLACLDHAYLLGQANQLVVLGNAVTPSWSSHFDVGRPQRNCQVAHHCIFSFSGAMGDTKGQPGLARSLGGLERASDGPNLIQFEQNTGSQPGLDVGAVG